MFQNRFLEPRQEERVGEEGRQGCRQARPRVQATPQGTSDRPRGEHEGQRAPVLGPDSLRIRRINFDSNFFVFLSSLGLETINLKTKLQGCSSCAVTFVLIVAEIFYARLISS